jgi:hypothetical protein
MEKGKFTKATTSPAAVEGFCSWERPILPLGFFKRAGSAMTDGVGSLDANRLGRTLSKAVIGGVRHLEQLVLVKGRSVCMAAVCLVSLMEFKRIFSSNSF